MRSLRFGLWAAIAVLALMLAVVSVSRIRQAPPPLAAGEPFGQPFQLVDQNGAVITEAAFRGQPTMVFFGFTHCPDICPTTLYEMNGLIGDLGPAGERLAAYFATVDPERDTVDVLKRYVTAISDRITGITGDPQDVEDMLAGFHVYFKKVPVEGGYTMDHTASIFLLDSKGRFVGTITHDETRETALAKLHRLLDRDPG